METWEMREAYYADAGRPADKPVEDRIARRMLNAAGFKNAEKGLSAYEAEFKGGTVADLPLWPRTRQLLYDMMRRAGRHEADRFDIQAFAVKSRKELAERMCAGIAGHRKPVYIVLEDNNAAVYTACLRAELCTQEVPFQALDGPDGFIVIRQTPAVFVRAYLSAER